MGRNSLENQMMALAINQVLALCYQQGVTTTLRDVFLLLRTPKQFYEHEWGLDDPISITSDKELLEARDTIMSRFGLPPQ